MIRFIRVSSTCIGHSYDVRLSFWTTGSIIKINISLLIFKQLSNLIKLNIIVDCFVYTWNYINTIILFVWREKYFFLLPKEIFQIFLWHFISFTIYLVVNKRWIHLTSFFWINFLLFRCLCINSRNLLKSTLPRPPLNIYNTNVKQKF